MERNYSIDLLKFTMAVLVVFLHTDWIGTDYVNPIARCAVPTFFMISGFLLYDGHTIGIERIDRNIKNIWHIFVWSSILFLVMKEMSYIVKGNFWFPSAQQAIKFLLFNEHPFYWHLWYIPAYLYTLIIMWIVDKYNLYKYLFFATPLLLLGDLVFGKYSVMLWGREFNAIYVRNFLFVGIPSFSLGLLIESNMNKIIGINKTIILTGGGILYLLCLLERHFLDVHGWQAARDHYISTTFLSVSFFLLFLNMKIRPNKLVTSGGQDSLYIYVLHPLVMYIMGMLVCRNAFMCSIYYYIAPMIIVFITVLGVFQLRKCKIIGKII